MDDGKSTMTNGSNRRDRDSSSRNLNQEPKMDVNMFQADESDKLSTEKMLVDLEKVMKEVFSKDKEHESDDDSDLRYDFFDRDKDNKIIQPKWIPMFPEDFSTRKQWPLSWWGIVEPPRELMYPEKDDHFRQGPGCPGGQYQHPPNAGPYNMPGKSNGYPMHEAANQQYMQHDYNHAYNFPSKPPNHLRPPYPHDGWGNNDSRNFDGRGGWHGRPPFNGPPGRGGGGQWGKDHPQSFQDEKRRHR